MKNTIAIIAGAGALPRQVAAACQAKGKPYLIIALEGHADPSWLPAHPHAWMCVGEVGKALDHLHQHQVTEIVFAGGVQRPTWHDLKLDATGLAWLTNIGLKALGDDKLLTLIAAKFAEHGFTVRSAQEVCGETLLAPVGVFGKITPTQQACEDIAFGANIIQTLYGTLDIGQAVVVQQGLVLGVEAIEGTDQLLQRCATLKRPGPGPILVKMAKPGQDTRVDLPSIGPQTIARAIEGGYQGIAVEAGRTIVLELPTLVQLANSTNVFVIGYNGKNL